MNFLIDYINEQNIWESNLLVYIKKLFLLILCIFTTYLPLILIVILDYFIEQCILKWTFIYVLQFGIDKISKYELMKYLSTTYSFILLSSYPLTNIIDNIFRILENLLLIITAINWKIDILYMNHTRYNIYYNIYDIKNNLQAYIWK